MREKPVLTILAAGALCAGAAVAALAQEGAPGPDRGSPGDVATFALAHELFELGRGRGDALAVLVAARLAGGIATAPGTGAVLTPGGPDTRDALVPPPDAGAMLALAAELTGGDATLLALVEDARAELSRGAVGGIKQWVSRVRSGYTDVWEIAFEGSTRAELAIIGDGRSNLDVVLTDENGNVLCFDSGPSDQVQCDFVPAWDGNFYLSVENAGSDRNTYYLVTN